MESLQQKIDQFENAIKILTEKIADLEKNQQKTGAGGDGRFSSSEVTPSNTKFAADIATGLSAITGGKVIWNTAELEIPPAGIETPVRLLTDSDKGYNKHSHGLYSGGALDINTLQLVEYEHDAETGSESYIVDVNGNKLNSEAQSYWAANGKIKTAPSATPTGENTKEVSKIGKAAWVFDANSQKWGISAFEIDLSKCWFVIRDEEGEIVLDDNGNEMKSLLYIPKKQTVQVTTEETETQTIIDTQRSSVIWDKDAGVWRLYAIYAEEPVVPTTEVSPTGVVVAQAAALSEVSEYKAPTYLTTILGVRG